MIDYIRNICVSLPDRIQSMVAGWHQIVIIHKCAAAGLNRPSLERITGTVGIRQYAVFLFKVSAHGRQFLSALCIKLNNILITCVIVVNYSRAIRRNLYRLLIRACKTGIRTYRRSYLRISKCCQRFQILDRVGFAIQIHRHMTYRIRYACCAPLCVNSNVTCRHLIRRCNRISGTGRCRIPACQLITDSAWCRQCSNIRTIEYLRCIRTCAAIWIKGDRVFVAYIAIFNFHAAIAKNLFRLCSRRCKSGVYRHFRCHFSASCTCKDCRISQGIIRTSCIHKVILNSVFRIRCRLPLCIHSHIAIRHLCFHRNGIAIAHELGVPLFEDPAFISRNRQLTEHIFKIILHGTCAAAAICVIRYGITVSGIAVFNHCCTISLDRRGFCGRACEAITSINFRSNCFTSCTGKFKYFIRISPTICIHEAMFYRVLRICGTAPDTVISRRLRRHR